MKRGIFGGSFDPPHTGHIKIALAAKEQLGLDSVVFLPTGERAPHKNDINASAKDRALMCRDVCEKFDFELSLYETEKEGNCYTADMMKHFKEVYKEDDLFLIVGGDSLDYMEKWHKPEEIFPLCTVVVAGRGKNYDRQADFLREKFSAKIVFLDLEFLNVSSTKIREAVSKGKDISGLVSPETEEFILKNKLYR